MPRPHVPHPYMPRNIFLGTPLTVCKVNMTFYHFSVCNSTNTNSRRPVKARWICCLSLVLLMRKSRGETGQSSRSCGHVNDWLKRVGIQANDWTALRIDHFQLGLYRVSSTSNFKHQRHNGNDSAPKINGKWAVNRFIKHWSDVRTDLSLYCQIVKLTSFLESRAALGGAKPKFLGGPNLRPTTDVIQAMA